MSEQQVGETVASGFDLGLSLVVGAIGKVLESPDGRVMITGLGAMFYVGLMLKMLRR